MSRFPEPLAPDSEAVTATPIEGGALVEVQYTSVREFQGALLQQRLVGIAEKNGGRLVVDMGRVQDMTSAGLAALVAASARCRDMGGKLVVYGLRPELRELLRVTRLDRAIHAAADYTEARRALEPVRRGRAFFGRKAA